ncbi:MFS transporter [Acidisoma cladoniae]|jgi:putative MFS transporter|uniref:MFS transporter n=1 Tax=Acidisoma cladoniae TaxID=3040935 RepID=UPI00254C900C|nr:MFS transporter [Acidisoma sp. PAMC 29798]
MDQITEPLRRNTSGRTVQQYIDEIPVWADGTAVDSLPMTGMQKRIWGLAIAGKFFEGLVVFMTGVALPLIDKDFGLHAAQNSVVTAATLFGILIGATLLGGLADVFGRKRMFIAEMVLFVIFLILLTLAQSFIWMAICLFGIGLALGCDYPTAHVVIAEAVPSRGRGGLILGAFAFQAVGAICGALLGVLILSFFPSLDAWRYMFAMAIIPAILVVIGRFFVCDSAHWLVSRGRMAEARTATMELLHREPQYPKIVELINPHHDEAAGGHVAPRGGVASLFDNAPHRRATFLASIPWFLQDLSTYGIGIFTPVILAKTLGSAGKTDTVAQIVSKVELSAKGTAMLDVLLIVGIIAAIFMVERAGRIRLQIVGFIGCAVGLGLAALSQGMTGEAQIVLLFAGFMLFNFMTNMGPNAQTYLLAGEVFPTHIRGYGAGFAASFAKIGAVLTAFLFPFLLKDIGTQMLLILLIISSLAGAVVTWIFRIETRGTLEDVGVNLERVQPQV